MSVPYSDLSRFEFKAKWELYPKDVQRLILAIARYTDAMLEPLPSTSGELPAVGGSGTFNDDGTPKMRGIRDNELSKNLSWLCSEARRLESRIHMVLRGADEAPLIENYYECSQCKARWAVAPRFRFCGKCGNRLINLKEKTKVTV